MNLRCLKKSAVRTVLATSAVSGAVITIVRTIFTKRPPDHLTKEQQVKLLRQGASHGTADDPVKFAVSYVRKAGNKESYGLWNLRKARPWIYEVKLVNHSERVVRLIEVSIRYPRDVARVKIPEPKGLLNSELEHLYHLKNQLISGNKSGLHRFIVAKLEPRVPRSIRLHFFRGERLFLEDLSVAVRCAEGEDDSITLPVYPGRVTTETLRSNQP